MNNEMFLDFQETTVSSIIVAFPKMARRIFISGMLFWY